MLLKRQVPELAYLKDACLVWLLVRLQVCNTYIHTYRYIYKEYLKDGCVVRILVKVVPFHAEGVDLIERSDAHVMHPKLPHSLSVSILENRSVGIQAFFVVNTREMH